MFRAFEETRQEKAKRIAKNLIEHGKLTLEVIASVTEISLKEVKKLAEEQPAQD